jgi:CBS domain-containing protein
MKLEHIAATPISDLSLRDPVRAKPDSTLFQIVTDLREHRRGAAIVEDQGGRLLGIFTERDLMLRVDHTKHDWHELPVSAFMSRAIITVATTESLAAAIERMNDGGFRHLPVVDESGRTIGILSIRDILAHITEYFPEEFINLPPDPGHEASGRWGG